MELVQIPAIAIALVLTCAVFVAGFLVIDGLTTTTTACSSGTWNATAASCWNGSANVDALLTDAGNSSIDVSTGMGNITGYAPTWGTIIGVAVLLSIVIGGFALGAVGYQMGKKRGYF